MSYVAVGSWMSSVAEAAQSAAQAASQSVKRATAKTGGSCQTDADCGFREGSGKDICCLHMGTHNPSKGEIYEYAQRCLPRDYCADLHKEEACVKQKRFWSEGACHAENLANYCKTQSECRSGRVCCAPDTHKCMLPGDCEELRQALKKWKDQQAGLTVGGAPVPPPMVVTSKGDTVSAADPAAAEVTPSGANGKDSTRLYLFAGAGAALLLAGLYYMGASSE